MRKNNTYEIRKARGVCVRCGSAPPKANCIRCHSCSLENSLRVQASKKGMSFSSVSPSSTNTSLKKSAAELVKLGYSNHLGKTFYEATYSRWRRHIEACLRLECADAVDSFNEFVFEILESKSNAVRDLILAEECSL